MYGSLLNEAVVGKVLQEKQLDIIMLNSMTLLRIGGLAQKNGAK